MYISIILVDRVCIFVLFLSSVICVIHIFCLCIYLGNSFSTVMFILLIPVNRLSIFYEFLLTVYTCIQCCVPLNRGLALHIVNGPNDANCPNASSRKKHGKPTNANIRIYGIRNAPKRSKRKKTISICMEMTLVHFVINTC